MKNSSPNNTSKKEIKTEPTSSSDSIAQNGQTGEEASVKTEAVNSLVDPVLSSTIEDINKYYKPELLYRLNGIDLNEVSFLFDLLGAGNLHTTRIVWKLSVK